MSQNNLNGLLSELEQIIRLMPPTGKIYDEDPDILQWIGRASAAVAIWGTLGNHTASARWNGAVVELYNRRQFGNPPVTMATILYQAQSDLRFKTVGPVNVAVGEGEVFRYFDEVRKIIEEARQDILFVDPYLDAGFVTVYLPHVKDGVQIRLLGKNKMSALRPAAEIFAKQSGVNIRVRSAKALHDRWIFMDKRRCFQSGASFKDGAVSSSTTFAENVDAFPALSKTFEDIWDSAT